MEDNNPEKSDLTGRSICTVTSSKFRYYCSAPEANEFNLICLGINEKGENIFISSDIVHEKNIFITYREFCESLREKCLTLHPDKQKEIREIPYQEMIKEIHTSTLDLEMIEMLKTFNDQELGSFVKHLLSVPPKNVQITQYFSMKNNYFGEGPLAARNQSASNLLNERNVENKKNVVAVT